VSRITRIGLVPISQPDESVRRYRLARLEEVSLATPPHGASNGSGSAPEQDVRHVVPAIRPQRATPPAGIRDRRVS